MPAPGYYVEEGNDYVVSSTRNGLRVPTYSRVDVRANRTFNWSRKRLTLFAEVINLLNRDNVRFNPPGVNTTTRRASNLFESVLPIVPAKNKQEEREKRGLFCKLEFIVRTWQR